MLTERPLLFVVFAIPLVLFGCGSGSETDQSSDGGQPDERVVTVDAVSVDQRDVDEVIQEVGSLRARDRTVVSSEIAGKVEEVRFTEGDAVEKEGNGLSAFPVLVTLDDDLLRAELKNYRARLETRRTELKQAQDTLERQRQMRENDATTDAEFTEAKISVEQVKAQIEEAKARIEQVREELVRTKIRAPFAGRLGERMVSPGTYVQPGDPIVEVARLAPIDVRFTVPEKFKDRLSVGQEVNVRVSAYPDRTFTGTVFFVSSMGEEETRTIPVKARIENNERQLSPGMFAQVRLVTNTRSNAPVIPDTAVVPRSDRQFVYVVEEGTARRREVQLGQRMNGEVEIRSGLDGSETVVVAGLQKLNDGVKVNVRKE